MKAVRFHQHGGPEVLRYEDVPDPELARRSSRPGARLRTELPRHLGTAGPRARTIPMPHISGSDVAGEVVASAGPDLAIGAACDAAAGHQLRPMRRMPVGPGQRVPEIRGARVSEPSRRLRGDTSRFRFRTSIAIPDEIDFVHAAAFPLTFLTAWHMLMTRAQLKRGEDVLVLAAGSGVGQAAIQIALLHGARVFATAGSDEKLERARALGAYEVIDHHKQDVAEEIKRLTDRRGVDVVVEHVGEATWAQSVRSLARGGRLVTCGATTGAEGRSRSAAVVRQAADSDGILHGHQGRAACARRDFSSRASSSRSSTDVSARGGGRCAAAARGVRAFRQDRPRGVMRFQRVGVSVFGVDRARQRRAGGGDGLALSHQSGHRRDGRQRGRSVPARARPRARAVRGARGVAQISIGSWFRVPGSIWNVEIVGFLRIVFDVIKQIGGLLMRSTTWCDRGARSVSAVDDRARRLQCGRNACPQ